MRKAIAAVGGAIAAVAAVRWLLSTAREYQLAGR